MRLLFVLVAMGASAFCSDLSRGPAGWPVWATSPGREMYQAPDPEIEEALLHVYRTASVSSEATLSGELREMVRGRNVVRISPEHHDRTEDGMAVVARVVITEDGDGARRHTFLAVVQGVGVAVVLHYDCASAERLSQYFSLLMRTASGVRFPREDAYGAGVMIDSLTKCGLSFLWCS